MTIQAPESLIYGADTLKLSDYPLAPFLAQRQLQLKFRSVNSGCWRGYIGAWEIIGQQLYLVGLSGELANGESLGIGTLFTDNPQRVFAHWYSDTVRCPSGKILRNKDWGYLGTHEKDIFLTFEAGIIG
jgi:hypothetical protein